MMACCVGRCVCVLCVCQKNNNTGAAWHAWYGATRTGNNTYGSAKNCWSDEIDKKHPPPTYWVLNGFSIVQGTNLIGRLAKSGQTNTGNVVECTDTKFGSGHGA